MRQIFEVKGGNKIGLGRTLKENGGDVIWEEGRDRDNVKPLGRTIYGNKDRIWMIFFSKKMGRKFRV